VPREGWETVGADAEAVDAGVEAAGTVASRDPVDRDVVPVFGGEPFVVPMGGVWTGTDGGVLTVGVATVGVFTGGVVTGPTVALGTVAEGTVTDGTDRVGTDTVGSAAREGPAAARSATPAARSAPPAARTLSSNRSSRDLRTNHCVDITNRLSTCPLYSAGKSRCLRLHPWRRSTRLSGRPGDGGSVVWTCGA
jgi:hypothetical protein